MQADEENSLTRQKWVRIMADFSADGVWNKQGQLCDLDGLPVSGELKKRISAWMDWFDRAADRTDRNAIPFDVRAFTKQGLDIARDVKRELPDWTVVYFDEEKSNESVRDGALENRSHFEYEIQSNETRGG
jgi:hypothetical protein